MTVYDDITTRALIVMQATKIFPEIDQHEFTTRIFMKSSAIFYLLQKVVDDPSDESAKKAVIKLLKLERR